jgi:hypothetical protein
MDWISDRLEIKGKGTFKITIGDDNDRRHNIYIPKSLNVPGLKKCLQSPQHWLQMVADKKTWMGNFDDCCILFLERRLKDRTFQHLNQWYNLLHGSFLAHVSDICCYI